MDIANEIAKYLANAGFGIYGTDVFVGQIRPDTNGIYVMRGSGSLNNYIPIQNTLVDIFVKDSISPDAITKLQNIKQYVHRMHTTNTANSFIYSILVLEHLVYILIDQQYANIYKLTIQVINRDISLIS